MGLILSVGFALGLGGRFGGRVGGGRNRAAFCQVPSGWHPLNGTYLDSAALAKEAGCTPASE